MQEYRFVLSHAAESDLNYISRSYQTGSRMSGNAATV
jgi:hypothetical protein